MHAGPRQERQINYDGEDEKVIYIRVPEKKREIVKQIAKKGNKTVNKMINDWLDERIGEWVEIQQMIASRDARE